MGMEGMPTGEPKKEDISTQSPDNIVAGLRAEMGVDTRPKVRNEESQSSDSEQPSILERQKKELDPEALDRVQSLSVIGKRLASAAPFPTQGGAAYFEKKDSITGMTMEEVEKEISKIGEEYDLENFQWGWSA